MRSDIGGPLVTQRRTDWATKFRLAQGPKPVFASRQMLAAAIAFVATMGLCLETLPKRLAGVCLLALLIWTAASVPKALPSNVKPPWRSVAAEIDEQYGSMTVVTKEYWVWLPLKHYRKEGGVILWSEFAEREKKDRAFLYLCRIGGKSHIETYGITSGTVAAIRSEWQWGESDGWKLFLYEVGGRAKLHENQAKPFRCLADT